MSGASMAESGSDDAAERAFKQPGDSILPPVPQNQLRAVCHRVKNDFQTIANLMALAQSFVKTPSQLATALEGRIGALSVAYGLFANSGHSPSLSELAGPIVDRVASITGQVALVEKSIEPILLSPRLCSSLSLWLYETVSNAMQHGIGDRTDGSLRIEADMSGGVFYMAVSDNGPGLPSDFIMDVDAKLGLRMALALARHDLAGNMELSNRRPGLSAVLEFSRDEFNSLNRESWT